MLFIAEKLHNNEISLEDAIDSEKIPEHVLHHFACDCAYRALQKELDAGRSPDPALFDAIKIKKDWIEGKTTDDALDAARYAARASAWYLARAARIAAKDAAWYLAREVPSATERVWPKQHLADLIEQYQHKRSVLLGTLLDRIKLIETAIPRWQAECEAGLYL